MARRGDNTVTPDTLPTWAKETISVVKETGAIGLACLVVAFYLGQQAGWIGDVSMQGHHDLAVLAQSQTDILNENQRILKSLMESNEKNAKSFMVLARGICLSVTVSKDIEARCLGGLP
jgi:hypothetical protein